MPTKRRQPLHHHVTRHAKLWLVPHKHNNHRPHLIRRHGLAIMAGLIVTVQIAANLLLGPNSAVLGYASDINVGALLALTNQQRAAAGLPALKLDTRLNSSATMKANNMFAENYWAHVSPSGIQPWYWFQQAGYAYTYAGENLAKDFDTSDGVVQGWMNSPGHRANILNVNYKDVGFAVVNGTLTGGQTTLVVAHYGALAAASPTPAPVAATPKPVVAAAVATPAPTPIPTAAPTPEPSLTPTPTAVPTVKVSPVVSLAPSAPVGQSYSLMHPLAILRTLNWGTLVTIGLLFILLLVYVATHFVAWRYQLKHWRSRHYRLWAAFHIGSLAVVITFLATSGFGKVG